MKFFFLFTALVFNSAAFALTPSETCPFYLEGLANPTIANFGGLKPRTPLQEMANLFLRYVPANHKEVVQIAIPTFLEFNPLQPEQFGDGQKNAFASYGSLPKAPFTAVLTRSVDPQEESHLAVILSKELPGVSDVQNLEFSGPGLKGGQTQVVPLSARDHMVRLQVNLADLNWNQISDTKPLFFRPVGWSDWFVVQFPNPYVRTVSLVSGMAAKFQTLPNGKSVVDPLALENSKNIQDDLRTIENSKIQGFQLARTERSQGVHGVYWDKNNNSQILTATGGLWSRYRLGEPFKIVYLAKDSRVLDIEEEMGVVSGTGPHYIDATAEIILNSVGRKSLMTLLGISSPTTTPDGNKVAWGFTHQWVGAWLEPNDAFVTPRGFYHWHLNHLTTPIGAQVVTPPEVPSSENHFGFPKK